MIFLIFVLESTFRFYLTNTMKNKRSFYFYYLIYENSWFNYKIFYYTQLFPCLQLSSFTAATRAAIAELPRWVLSRQLFEMSAPLPPCNLT